MQEKLSAHSITLISVQYMIFFQPCVMFKRFRLDQKSSIVMIPELKLLNPPALVDYKIVFVFWSCGGSLFSTLPSPFYKGNIVSPQLLHRYFYDKCSIEFLSDLYKQNTRRYFHGVESTPFPLCSKCKKKLSHSELCHKNCHFVIPARVHRRMLQS